MDGVGHGKIRIGWIADKGYDSDPLRERLAKRGIDLICPYRSNNKEQKYYDGRKINGISVVIKSNGRLRGLAITAGWLSDGIVIFWFTKHSFILLVSS
jgi:hypothetical protein